MGLGDNENGYLALSPGNVPYRDMVLDVSLCVQFLRARNGLITLKEMTQNEAGSYQHESFRSVWKMTLPGPELQGFWGLHRYYISLL